MKIKILGLIVLVVLSVGCTRYEKVGEPEPDVSIDGVNMFIEDSLYRLDVFFTSDSNLEFMYMTYDNVVISFHLKGKMGYDSNDSISRYVAVSDIPNDETVMSLKLVNADGDQSELVSFKVNTVLTYQ